MPKNRSTPYFRVVNLDEYQHYSDRSPPWIKLHAKTLESYDFGCLQDASKAHLMLIWLLASRTSNRLPYDAVWIGNKIQAREPVDLDELQDSGFIEVFENASALQATRLRDARPETEGETEKRERQSQTTRTLARANAHGNGLLDFEQFRNAYPKRAGSHRWPQAQKAANARIREGHSFDEILDGAVRYHRFCEATDKIGTEFVMQAATFLGTGKHFAEPWVPPPPSGKEDAISQMRRLRQEGRV